jgi:predicted acyltransferase
MSTAEPSPTAVAPDRVRSIDALRGFDMFWIMGGETVVHALAHRVGGQTADVVKDQLEHVEWDGFHFEDLIFPLFLFLVGTVLPFSLAAARRRGATTAQLYARVLRRTALLFLLGLICNRLLQLDWLYDGSHVRVAWNQIRIAGVLQRIAVCYGLAALIHMHLGWRGVAAVVVAILVGYWALLMTVPAPGFAAGDLSKAGNLAGYLDRQYLPGKIVKAYYGDGDNEGLLSTLPAVATALIGVLAGLWLRSEATPGRKTLGLAAAGAATLALGMAWAPFFPIIKNLWTSSFVLVAGGWSLLLLALFYGVIDGLGWKAWSFFFVVIGANAIAIFIVPRFIDFPKIAGFFFGGPYRVSGDYTPLVKASGDLAVKWLFLYVLYRNRWVLRV